MPNIYWSVLWERNSPWEATDALLNLAMEAGQYGYIRIQMGYTRTDNARNRITRAFCRATDDPDAVVIMLDNDHKHPGGLLTRLASRPEDIVAALAFRRSPPYDPLFYVRDESGNLRQPAEWEPGAVYYCQAVGTGAIAIKRRVFTALEAAGFTWPWFRYEYPEGDIHPTEDLYFCRLCEQAGVTVACDTGAVIPHLAVQEIDQTTWAGYMQAHPEMIA